MDDKQRARVSRRATARLRSHQRRGGVSVVPPHLVRDGRRRCVGGRVRLEVVTRWRARPAGGRRARGRRPARVSAMRKGPRPRRRRRVADLSLVPAGRSRGPWRCRGRARSVVERVAGTGSRQRSRLAQGATPCGEVLAALPVRLATSARGITATAKQPRRTACRGRRGWEEPTCEAGRRRPTPWSPLPLLSDSASGCRRPGSPRHRRTVRPSRAPLNTGAPAGILGDAASRDVLPTRFVFPGVHE